MKKVEGKLVSDLASMSKIMAKAKDTMTIELTDGCIIVLDAEKAKSHSPLILERYQISKETSLEIS